jgi:GDP-6-deoxy-D-talose 4-dehydrogenase
MQRALVTGVSGFTGRVLAPMLKARGIEVFGTCAPAELSAHAPELVHEVDLLDFRALRAVIQRVQPDCVIHLAAISFVAHSDVEALYRTNIIGTRYLLQALSEVSAAPPRHVILASSANIYGNSECDPIGEDAPARPANDYAVSKLSMEHMAALWFDRLPITIVRPFNYTGRGQSLSFLVPKIVDAYRRRAASVELGNLAVERDFSDVRDVADAYARLLHADPGGVLNICSGRATSLHDVLRIVQRISGHELEVKVNPAFVRGNEVKRLRGSNARLLTRLPGWQSRSLEDTLAWMLTADQT